MLRPIVAESVDWAVLECEVVFVVAAVVVVVDEDEGACAGGWMNGRKSRQQWILIRYCHQVALRLI